jgi:ubiquinone/menaquinone biosynthesis C-methylase UbiE
MPSFATRTRGDEMMDDFSIVDERLFRALEDLRGVNRLLGGYATTMAVLGPFLKAQRGRTVRILDLGTGIADYPEHIVRWAARQDLDVEVVGIDANPVTVEAARSTLDRRLAPPLRRRIRLEVADALKLPYADRSFSVATAALFLHHFDTEEAALLVGSMARVAADGLIINDLHRHRLAYYGIIPLGSVLPVSEMFQHDGPVSVLRGFRRGELEQIARKAGVASYEITWHWAFRWCLSSLGV